LPLRLRRCRFFFAKGIDGKLDARLSPDHTATVGFTDREARNRITIFIELFAPLFDQLSPKQF
jgi:hypothetical protein